MVGLVDTIARKRDGEELESAAIQDFVAGVCDGRVGDGQLGAFLMAVCCRGMTPAECSDLTLAMRDSGTVLDLRAIPGPKIDKHSTGGVGDKVSLLLAPLMAACGVKVPMISGRGLGHTGGTLDKLASIPGYEMELDAGRFAAVLEEVGYVMAGATAAVAPADRRMYALRDVSATVASIPLITASILSKKLAAGIEGLVMDVKVGRAAFLPRRRDAEALADSLCAVGREAGLEVRALLTDMDAPLGRSVGNALEVAEVCAALAGDVAPDLWEVVEALGVEMLGLAGIEPEAGVLRRALDSGAAAEAFARNLRAQGAAPDLLEHPERLPQAPEILALAADRGGTIGDLDPLDLGQVVVELGGGRRQPADRIDHAVGLRLHKSRGDTVAPGEVWCEIHAGPARPAAAVRDRVAAALRLTQDPPQSSSRILGRRG